MIHKTSITANGVTCIEYPSESTLTGAVTWTKIQTGFYRGTHDAFVTGSVFVMPYVRPLAAGGELFIDVVETNEPNTNAIDIVVLDANGDPCDEFFARLDITVI